MLEMKVCFMGAFHAYDIRGVYNVDFDKEVAYKVGYFLPELLSADKVLVGRDARVSSPEIHEYLLKGITDAGADVYDIGLSTTPMVYFGTANYGFKASVQITASHADGFQTVDTCFTSSFIALLPTQSVSNFAQSFF